MTIQIQTNTERLQSLSFPPVVDAPSSLSPFIFTQWWSWNRVEAPGAAEGTALWTSQVCPAGSAVQCIIESARFGCGLSSRTLQHVTTSNWCQTSLQSLSNKLIDVSFSRIQRSLQQVIDGDCDLRIYFIGSSQHLYWVHTDTMKC